MLHPERRRQNRMIMMVKTHCCFCDKEEEVPFNCATDYVCADCRKFFKTEMEEPRRANDERSD